MPGLGQAFLPLPKFSRENPYWQDPRILWGWLRPELRPRNSAHDFMYAGVWEMRRFDVHGAHCMRALWTKYCCQRFIKKEKQNEETVKRNTECSNGSVAANGDTRIGATESSL